MPHARLMKTMRKLLISCLVILLPLASLALDRDHFIALNKKGRELAQQKDWKGLREVLVEIGKEMQGVTPRYVLRMASVETHLGNTDEALRWMQLYVDMGLSYDVSKDDDLKPLLENSGFRKIEQEMKERTKRIQQLEPVCTLPLADLMPEDLTFEKSSGTFIVSSIRHHTVYRLTLPKQAQTECQLKELPLDAEAKRWPVLAVSYDNMRKALWMTSSAMPGFGGFPKEDEGKAALLAIDPQTGHTLRRFDLESKPAVLGDMSVAADGTVYVSDSVGGGVYRVRGDLKKAALEKIANGLFSPQTPALAQDGKRLFVADYPIGIAVIDLTRPSAALNYLPHPDSVAATGLDGLYLAGDSLIGVQNGTDPQRLVRFQLDHAQTRIISSEVMEQATEQLGSPTHAIGVNGWIYVSGNTGWDKVDDHGVLKAGEKFSKPMLLRARVH